MQQPRHADVAGGEAAPAGALHEGAGQEALADARRPGDQQVVPVLDPAAASEAEHLLAIQAARVLEVDVFERRRLVARLGRAQPAGQLALLAGGPLAVDQEPHALLEAQLGVLARAELLLEGLGHRRELHPVHLLQRLLGQHSVSSSAAA